MARFNEGILSFNHVLCSFTETSSIDTEVFNRNNLRGSIYTGLRNNLRKVEISLLTKLRQ